MSKTTINLKRCAETVLLLLSTPSLLCLAQAHGSPWTGTWAVSPMRGNSEGQSFRGKTLRQIVHTSVGGHILRIHLSNLFGTAPLTINDMHIARWSTGSSVVAGTSQKVVFRGLGSITIQAGSEAVSDPIRFKVPPLSDIAISIFVHDTTGPATYHQSGFQTNYIANGDVSEEASLSDFKTTKSCFYLTGIDVRDRSVRGSVVTLGASITDGFNSASDSNRRWPNDLAKRLIDAERNIGVLNEGISGNRLLSGGAGDTAQIRFARDVLAQPGVRWVIFSDDPINDLGAASNRPTADQLIAGLQLLIDMAHRSHVKFFCSTLTPFQGANYWTPDGEGARERINDFIRSNKSNCDGIVDQDTATHDPSHPTQYLPAFDSGDHLHPNEAGLQAIADAVDIDRLAQ